MGALFSLGVDSAIMRAKSGGAPRQAGQAVKRQSDDRVQRDDSGRTRREFLKRAPLFMAGGVALGVAVGKVAMSRFARRRRPPVVPEGSIFTPAASPDDRA